MEEAFDIELPDEACSSAFRGFWIQGFRVQGFRGLGV